jgi:hypothetical protein
VNCASAAASFKKVRGEQQVERGGALPTLLDSVDSLGELRTRLAHTGSWKTAAPQDAEPLFKLKPVPIVPDVPSLRSVQNVSDQHPFKGSRFKRSRGCRADASSIGSTCNENGMEDAGDLQILRIIKR